MRALSTIFKKNTCEFAFPETLGGDLQNQSDFRGRGIFLAGWNSVERTWQFLNCYHVGKAQLISRDAHYDFLSDSDFQLRDFKIY